MNNPLKWHHEMARELTCCIVGHKWKVTPRRKTQYYDMDKHEVPYAYRKSTGNYMWENVAWWSAKCTRCRLKTREWPYQPFHFDLFLALRIGIKSIFSALGSVFIWEDARLWRKFVFGIPTAVAFGLCQGYAQ